MDRRRMDADGGRGVHRDRRTRKLAVVVAVQNVLVAVCLLVTLYVYWDVKGRVSKLWVTVQTAALSLWTYSLDVWKNYYFLHQLNAT